MAAAGISTAALAFGGEASGPQVAVTEDWNGTSWTEGNDLNTARQELGAAGTSTVALGFAGAAPDYSAATEEWNAPSASSETITTS